MIFTLWIFDWLGFNIFHLIFESLLNCTARLPGQGYQDSIIISQPSSSHIHQEKTPNSPKTPKSGIHRESFLTFSLCCAIYLLFPQVPDFLSAHGSSALWMISVQKVIRRLGRNDSNGKGKKGSQMLGIHE